MQDLQHGNVQSSKTCPQLPDSAQIIRSGAGVQAHAALLSVIFGHVVRQPVHFGFPALAQGFVKLQSEVLQCLLVRLPESQGILKVRGKHRCSPTESATKQLTAQILFTHYSIERNTKQEMSIYCF